MCVDPADEMGLGKTVELLACILANGYNSTSTPSPVETARRLLEDKLARRKRERVDCACGATEEDENYTFSWVQCDICDAWQHGICVGYASLTEVKEQRNRANAKSGKRLSIVDSKEGDGDEKLNGVKRRKIKKGSGGFREHINWKKGDSFVCGACAELIGGVKVIGDCGATLVVCPTPILQQWQDEILRSAYNIFPI
jgi:E3 ubiquitin-protein ligase SHPRH